MLLKFVFNDFLDDRRFKNIIQSNMENYLSLLGEFVNYCTDNEVVNVEDIGTKSCERLFRHDGIGSKAESWREIPASYAHAAHALKYKFALGMDRLIQYEELKELQNSDLSIYYDNVSSIIDEFRMMKSDWEERFEEFLRQLENDLPPEEEIRHVFVFFHHSLQRMVDTVPEEIREFWQSAQADIDKIMELETLGLRCRFYRLS